MARLLAFAKLQCSAAIFGIALLVAIMATAALWQENWPVYRYDALFVAVLGMQAWLLASGRETWSEARVIFAFHIIGVAMEVFKTAYGSWEYPEPSLLKIGGVPLFTGFMYSAVGSYIARLWKLTETRLTGAPPEWAGGLLALAIYANFMTHHFILDARYVLMILTLVLYGRCWAVAPGLGKIPIIAVFIFVGLLVYAAENIGSASGTWLYPNQHREWKPVHIGKLGSWILLMIVSFSLVRLVKADDSSKA